jgi:hypothetical protein
VALRWGHQARTGIGKGQRPLQALDMDQGELTSMECHVDGDGLTASGLVAQQGCMVEHEHYPLFHNA